MKKLILFLMICTLKVLAVAENAPQIETYFDDDKTGGIRITTQVSDLRLTTRPDKQNFGAAVFTSNVLPSLPLTVKAGNLSAGGALSTLNSPELSAGASPFTASVTSASSLTAALPDYSNFSKPVSAFLEASIPQKQSPLPFALKLNTLFSPASTSPISSVQLNLPIPDIALTLSASCTGGLFNYQSNANSSWFLKSPYYSAGTHYCALFQFSAESKSSTKKSSAPQPLKAFSINLTGALYESPYNFYQFIYRADTSITTKRTNFFAQIFYNPYDHLLTSSGKTLTPSLQFKTGTLFKSPAKLASLYLKTPVFLRAGTNIYSKINLTQNEHPLKANAGLQFSKAKTAQSFSISAEGNLISSEPPSPPQTLSPKSISAQLKSTWKTDSFSPSLTANLTIPNNPSSQKKYKITAGAGYKSKKSTVTINATTSLTGALPTQTQSPVPKLTSSLTIHLKIKYTTIIGKISFNEDIEI